MAYWICWWQAISVKQNLHDDVHDNVDDNDHGGDCGMSNSMSLGYEKVPALESCLYVAKNVWDTIETFLKCF